jgi:hypothetical protein
MMCLALPVNVNQYLAIIARFPLAKLFVASWEARHGQKSQPCRALPSTEV